MYFLLFAIQTFSFIQMMTMARKRGHGFFSGLPFGLAGIFFPVVSQVAYTVFGGKTASQQHKVRNLNDRRVEMQRKVSAFVSQTNNLLNQRAGIDKYSMQKEYEHAVSVSTIAQNDITFSMNRIELFSLKYDEASDRFYCKGDSAVAEKYISIRQLRRGIGFAEVMTLTNLVCLNHENEKAARQDVLDGKAAKGRKEDSIPEPEPENMLFGQKINGELYEQAGIGQPEEHLKGVLSVKDTPEGFELLSGAVTMMSVSILPDGRASVDPSLEKDAATELAVHVAGGENLYGILSCREASTVKEKVSGLCLGETNVSAARTAAAKMEKSRTMAAKRSAVKKNAAVRTTEKKGKAVKIGS